MDDWDLIDDDGPLRRPRRRRRPFRTFILLLITLLGLTLMAGSYYVWQMPVPPLDYLGQSTTVYYRDGITVMARLGGQNRTVLAYTDMVDSLPRAVVAGTEPKFWTSSVGPIARGVSRMVADLQDASLTTRARTTIMAWKLGDTYSKEQVLSYYMNGVSFGRGAYGVEAAADAYFHKSANKHAKPEQQLTPAEAVAIAAMADQPGPDLNQSRWNATRDGLVAAGYLSKDAAKALVFPEPVAYDAKAGTGMERSVGLAATHALAELAATTEFKGKSWSQIVNGGYKIVTTVDQQAQLALEKAADGQVEGSALFGQPKNLQAAAVLVEPGTGRVLAYFGNHAGNGADYAGWYVNDKGEAVGFGSHPPGGTFYVHTLAAALKAGISVKSMWDVRDGAGKVPTRCPTGKTACSLADATTASIAPAFQDVTKSVSPLKVVEMAQAAGVQNMWTDDRKRTALQGGLDALVPSSFNEGVGVGQYPVTVLDQANAMATYASGLRATPHFVQTVFKGDTAVYGETLGKPEAVLSKAALADLSWTLSRTSAGKLPGLDSASETGVWATKLDSSLNAHAWIVGYTSKLAMAVWVGNNKDENAIKDKAGKMITGDTLPAAIYRTVMPAVHTALNLKPPRFAKPVFAGNLNPPESVHSG
jgi:membrane peptidoglycan carboxypeptidase